MKQEQKDQIMRLVIDIGKKSISEDGKLSPKVGAVLFKDDKILGSAFRGQYGVGDHAEYTLLEKVLGGQDVTDAILFTTLEPCTYRNNHKPCSEWIIEKGIKHVFIGFLDPNPKIYNKGCKKLKSAGVEVSYFPKNLREEIMNDNKIFIGQFKANPELEGNACFNYSDNNGIYIIGNNDMIFETMWTKASDIMIHAYNDPITIKSIAIAEGNIEIDEIKDATVYDSSSRVRTIHRGKILVLENNNGYFAAIKILDIKDSTRNDNRDELYIKYKILDDKTADFTKN